MKKTQTIKLSVLALSLVLLVGAVFAIGASATTIPEISAANVMYTDKFSLMYAIKADSVSGDSVTLNVYDQYPNENVDPIKDYTVTKVTPAGKEEGESGLDYDAYIVVTDGVSAVALDTVFYVQAVDANENASEVVKYSVVEYLYTRLAEVDGVKNKETQNDFYKTTIAFGTAAQKNFLTAAELAETTLISDYCYVTTYGCTIDGATSGVYPQNKALTVAGDNGALSSCTVTTYDSYDTTGTETVESVTGSEITVDGFRAHIEAGAKRTYREGTVDFESYTIGAKPVVGDNSTNNASTLMTGNDSSLRAATIASDKIYGASSNVLPITFTAGQVRVNPLCGITAEEANAFEISFDIKIDNSAAKEGLESLPERMGISAEFYVDESGRGKVQLFEFNSGSSYGNFKVDRQGDTYSQKFDTMANEWHYVRIVIKNDADNQTKAYVYVNNAETPLVWDWAYDIDPSAIQYVKLNKIQTYIPTVYFDNVFCGYIAE